MKTVEHLVLAYVTDRKQAGRFRGGTPRIRQQVLLQFADQVGPNLDVAKLTPKKLASWASHLNVAPTTRRARISAVRCFCAWLTTNDHLRADPSRHLEPPRMPRMVPRGLDATIVAKLFAHLPDARAELVTSLMVQEGLRCVEVANLHLGDVDVRNHSIFVRGKGGNERVVALTDETRDAIARYLAEHPASFGPLVRRYRPDGTSTHLPIRPATLSMWMSQWMAAAGIKSYARDGVSAHALRHTAATDMLRNGAHVRDVQAALGHASLTTTQRYMPWVVGDLRSAMGGRKYRAAQPPDPDSAA